MMLKTMGEMNVCAAAIPLQVMMPLQAISPLRSRGRFDSAAVADRSNGHHTER